MAIDADLLRRLTARRWLVPVLAEMHQGPGSRFGMLVRRLGVSRSMLSASLDTLEGEGWISRNPGHGHPLRPEYLLTAGGRAAASWSAVAAEAVGSVELRRWSLPALQALAQGKDRFRDLAESLAPVTPRALSMALDQLIEAGLAERLGEPSRHPRYRLTGQGEAMALRLGLGVHYPRSG